MPPSIATIYRNATALLLMRRFSCSWFFVMAKEGQLWSRAQCFRRTTKSCINDDDVGLALSRQIHAMLTLIHQICWIVTLMDPGSILCPPPTCRSIHNFSYQYHNLTFLPNHLNQLFITLQSIPETWSLCLHEAQQYQQTSLICLWPPKATRHYGFDIVLPSLSNCICSQTPTHS